MSETASSALKETQETVKAAASNAIGTDPSLEDAARHVEDYGRQENKEQLSKEEADRLYEERIEEENFWTMAPNVEKAKALIDTAHSEDPNLIEIDGKSTPYELHYAQKCSRYLDLHTPDADPLLTIAVRAQHFRRWEVPRDTFPRTKPGYFQWRTFLKKRQADQVKDICLQCDFAEDEASRVAALVAKEDLKKGEGKGDAEAQILEDVACLVFLDDQFDEFEKHHDEDKIIGILQKTWVKMGKRGQDLALAMDLSDRAKELIGKALAS